MCLTPSHFLWLPNANFYIVLLGCQSNWEAENKPRNPVSVRKPHRRRLNCFSLCVAELHHPVFVTLRPVLKTPQVLQSQGLHSAPKLQIRPCKKTSLAQQASYFTSFYTVRASWCKPGECYWEKQSLTLFGWPLEILYLWGIKWFVYIGLTDIFYSTCTQGVVRLQLPV